MRQWLKHDLTEYKTFDNDWHLTWLTAKLLAMTGTWCDWILDLKMIEAVLDWIQNFWQWLKLGLTDNKTFNINCKMTWLFRKFETITETWRDWMGHFWQWLRLELTDYETFHNDWNRLDWLQSFWQ